MLMCQHLSDPCERDAIMEENEHVIMRGYARLTAAMLSLQRNLERIKTEHARPLNLKNGEVFIMYMLYDNINGVSAEQLSKECGMDRAMISRSIQSLLDKGYLKFKDLPQGKRRYGTKICLSEQGMQIGKTVTRWATDIQDYLDEGIPREHIEIMYATLSKLCERLNLFNRRTACKGSGEG